MVVSGTVPLLDSRVSVCALPVGDPHAEFGGGGSLDALQVKGGWVWRSDLTTFLLPPSLCLPGSGQRGPYPVGGQAWRACVCVCGDPFLESAAGLSGGVGGNFAVRRGVEWKSLDVKT